MEKENDCLLFLGYELEYYVQTTFIVTRKINAMLSFLERKFQCLLYLEGIMNDLFILSMRVSRTVIKNSRLEVWEFPFGIITL